MTNKFDFLKRVREQVPNGEAEPREPHAGAAEEGPPLPSPALAAKAERKRRAAHVPAGATPPKKRGRPSGKRSDEAYIQVTAYIRRETHFAVKLNLLHEQKGREFSELVEELLSKWNKASS